MCAQLSQQFAHQFEHFGPLDDVGNFAQLSHTIFSAINGAWIEISDDQTTIKRALHLHCITLLAYCDQPTNNDHLAENDVFSRTVTTCWCGYPE